MFVLLISEAAGSKRGQISERGRGPWIMSPCYFCDPREPHSRHFWVDKKSIAIVNIVRFLNVGKFAGRTGFFGERVKSVGNFANANYARFLCGIGSILLHLVFDVNKLEVWVNVNFKCMRKLASVSILGSRFDKLFFCVFFFGRIYP